MAMGEAFLDPDQLPLQSGLPDPLTYGDGRPVETPQQWFGHRRPELKALFEHYMLGRLPAAASIKSEVLFEDSSYLQGAATLKEIALDLGPPAARRMHLLVAIPNNAKRPAPVFVALNHTGNHSLTDHPQVRIAPSLSEQVARGDAEADVLRRGSRTSYVPLAEMMRRGYAAATFCHNELAPDRAEDRSGMQYVHGQERGAHGCGAIGIWAWGVMRAVDQLLSEPGVDYRRIAAVGHSRRGKAVLFAAAFDERIALVIPHQSGTGGAAPSRSAMGESLQQLNSKFHHWFAPIFARFNGRPERLPFDQHCLVALVAPRPVLLTTAVEDTWANPPGQFEMLRQADKVYRFLAAEGLGAREMPSPGQMLKSRLGFLIRPGAHAMGLEDWQSFMDYADAWIGPAKR